MDVDVQDLKKRKSWTSSIQTLTRFWAEQESQRHCRAINLDLLGFWINQPTQLRAVLNVLPQFGLKIGQLIGGRLECDRLNQAVAQRQITLRQPNQAEVSLRASPFRLSKSISTESFTP